MVQSPEPATCTCTSKSGVSYTNTGAQIATPTLATKETDVTVDIMTFARVRCEMGTYCARIALVANIPWLGERQPEFTTSSHRP